MKGGVVALGFDEKEAAQIDAVNRGVVLEKERVFRRRGFSGYSVIEFENGFGEAAEVERFDEVIDDIELVAFGSKFGVGADDDHGGATGKSFEEGNAVDAGKLKIEEYDVEVFGGQKVQGRRAVIDFQTVVESANLVEKRFDEIASEWVVVNDEAFHASDEYRIGGLR